MTHKYPTEFEQIEMRVACLLCGALPGEWCVTKGGHIPHYLHSPRFHYATRIKNAEATRNPGEVPDARPRTSPAEVRKMLVTRAQGPMASPS